MLKNQTPILSTVAFDESEHNIKSLVSKIDNMIKSDDDLAGSKNILEGIESQLPSYDKQDSQLFFGEESGKISEINYIN